MAFVKESVVSHSFLNYLLVKNFDKQTIYENMNWNVSERIKLVDEVSNNSLNNLFGITECKVIE